MRRMRRKKKRRILICSGIIFGIILIIGGILAYMKWKNTKKIVSTDEKKYIAYIKINPSIKLNYSQVCIKYSDETSECEKPIVYDYELVNDDAKEIFKDDNILADSKDLAKVIDFICEKTKESGIDVSNVEIQSDWNDLNNYLKEEAKVNNSLVNSNNKVENNYIVTVNNANKDVIDNKIKTDESEEKKAKAASTIKISDNVRFNHSMLTFTCNNCFSNSLIDTLKKAKGHAVVSANSNTITIKRITSLSGSYNKSTYFGNSLIDKIRTAGGEESGGGGGSLEVVTLEICKEYNLICE